MFFSNPKATSLVDVCTDLDYFRMATNKIITVAIITVLVLLIIAVIVSKFR